MRPLLPFFLGVVAIAAACVRPSTKAPTSRTSATSSATPAAAEGAAACASCHAQEAAEWDASLHHASFTDRDFQISFHAEPMPFCFGCHAPQAANTKDERGAALGVGCTSCHSIASEHGTKNTVATTTTTSCSSCHEFSFPNKPALMQSTATEHRASAFADVSCSSCHLPKQADGHRDHRFDVTRNEALLRKAITLQSRRTKTGVVVKLTTNGVGHAMPTGDLFRRLRVSLHALAADGTLLDEREALLGRSQFSEHQEKDDRIVGRARAHVRRRRACFSQDDRDRRSLRARSPNFSACRSRVFQPDYRGVLTTMRRAFLLSFLIVGCGASTVASEPPPKVAATTTSMPPGNNTPAPPAAISATASPAAVIDDSPLPWGTRPSRTGPLFPVVDGVCVHGEMWPLADGTTLYSYGNPSGGYSRGGAATLAVFTDSGLDRNADSFKLANPTKEKGAFDSIAPFSMTGTWSPGPLLVYSNDSGGGRTRDYPTIWQRTPESGWSILTSYGGDDNGPSFGRKPLLFKGNAIVTKFVTDFQGNGATTTVISATKIAKDAATLANIGALTRSDLSEPKVYTNDEELYFSGFLSTTSTPVVRVWKDGKVREVKWPALPKDTYGKIVASKPSLLVMTDKTLHQLEGDTFTTWPITGIPNGSKPKSVAVAPNGDVWIALSPRTMVLKREASSGKITELPVPLPADTNAAKEGELAHWPASGADLAGVEYNDPYVIAEGGQIAHFENGKWSLIEMPKTPFASAGRYRAQLLAMPAKGDLYVNAGYGEKGLGWKTWERYRAILRTKRPNETLRCNEPGGGASWASGKGFMSFPPLADDKCTTPFVMIVRTAYDLSSSSPMVMHDRKSDWPTVRESVKATPSLTNNNTLTTIDLIEFESGDQRYVGAKVPSIQSGKDLVESAAKRVKVVGDIGLRPELLCATTPPKILRTLRVDLATGKVLPQ